MTASTSLGLGLLLLLAGPLASWAEVGITLPPMRLGLGVGVSVEGDEPFHSLQDALAQVVDHPVQIQSYTKRDGLVRDLEAGLVSFAILSCESFQKLSPRFQGQSRVLGALVLADQRSYQGVLMRSGEKTPKLARRLVAVPSAESVLARRPELLRRRLRVRPARGCLDALDRLLRGEVEFAMVPDLALVEARRQGLEVESLEMEATTPPLPFEAFLVAPSVSPRFDGRLRTVLLATKARSPRGVSVEWRVLQQEALTRECAR